MSLPSYDDAVGEELPQYKAAVEKYVVVQYKLEYSTPFNTCKDTTWYETVMHINSTQLNFYTKAGVRLPESSSPVALTRSRTAPSTNGTVDEKPSGRRLSEKLSRFTKTYLPAFDPIEFKSGPGSNSGQTQVPSNTSPSVVRKRWQKGCRPEGACIDDLYDVHSEFEITETKDCMDVSRENNYRMDRSYSLQGAHFGLSTSEFKTRFYVDAEEKYKDGYLLNLRVRAENQQFLIRFNRINDMILWCMYLNIGTNIAKDLQEREYPNYRVVPRRSRRSHTQNSNNRRRRRTSNRGGRMRSSTRITLENSDQQITERKRSNSLFSHLLGSKGVQEPAEIDFKNPFKADCASHTNEKTIDKSNEILVKERSMDNLTPPASLQLSVTRTASPSASSFSSRALSESPDLSRSPSTCFSLFQSLTTNSSFCEYDTTGGKGNPFSLEYNFDIWSPANFSTTFEIKSSIPKIDRSFSSVDSNFPVIGEVSDENEVVDLDEDQETDIDMDDYGLEEVETNDENNDEEVDDDEDNDFDENNKWDPFKKGQSRRRYIKHALRCVKPLLKDDNWVGEKVYLKLCPEDAKRLYPKVDEKLRIHAMAVRTVGQGCYD
ncbi:hypothetical protein RNJ44_04364 [Nakaseomyces bracarensis]|uniref:Uncharacterized protein n=1 Tax=Nakaseomyces bracarensis TaxID=273131 RepID=A0ABR4NUU1_9SACH